MKTHVIREIDGGVVVIRAIATPTEDVTWDKCETKAFFSDQAKQNAEHMAKMAANLADMAENGPPQPHDDSKFKKLAGTDDLFELKAGKLRVFCFWDDGMLITTHGMVKSTQKTPKYELAQAEKTKKEYFQAKQNKNLTHVQRKETNRKAV